MMGEDTNAVWMLPAATRAIMVADFKSGRASARDLAEAYGLDLYELIAFLQERTEGGN